MATLSGFPLSRRRLRRSLLRWLRGAFLSVILTVPARGAVWSGGHGDLVLRYHSDGGTPGFTAAWRVGTGGDAAVVDGGDVYDAGFPAPDLIPAAGATPIPSPSPLHTGGGTVHLLPADSTDALTLGVPFLGWNLEGVTSGMLQNDRAALRLTGWDGPGQASLWTGNGLGALTFYWSTADGLSQDDTLLLGPGAHFHADLGFSAPGTYRLDLAVVAVTAGGASVMSPFSLNFAVVPEARTTTLLLTLATLPALLRKRPRHPSITGNPDYPGEWRGRLHR